MTFQHWLQGADKGNVRVKDKRDILISAPGVLSLFHPEILKFLTHLLKPQLLSPHLGLPGHGTGTPVQGQHDYLKL